MQTFYVIGMGDSPRPCFPPDVRQVMACGKVFSGGRRHYELVRSLLPADAEWIDIAVPLTRVFQQYKGHAEVVVFASGDPLFFGFANTIRRELPQARILLFPFFNSLQMLAHRMLLPYQDMRMVSLTGRPWEAFDAALIRGEKLLGILTDRQKTPAVIAARMLEYGYDNYRMTVGEALGNDEQEKVSALSLQEAVQRTFSFPNCLVLEQTSVRFRPFGIPEDAFHLLDGRARMITKMPVRLLTISMLALSGRRSFWDIGSCTGSVSVEAKLQYPDLGVYAFEQRPQGKELMERNSRKFGTPGITTTIGDFLSVDVGALPPPDAVFIGGHGGKLAEILQKIEQVLLPGGVIVFNSVSQESKELFIQGIARINRKITGSIRVAVDAFNPIEIMKAE